MTLYTATDLVKAFEIDTPISDTTVTGISIDTRTLDKGDLFFALNDRAFEHIERAFEKGASYVVIDGAKSIHNRNNGELFARFGTRIIAKDGASAQDMLNRLARFARNRYLGRVIAITGSVGKTTLKNMLRETLSAFAPTDAAVGSYNNHLGVPLTLARLNPNTQFAVLEIGMNHVGEIKPLADLVAPHIGIVTAVESAHIGNMGDITAIAREKFTLCDALGKNGAFVVPQNLLVKFPEIAVDKIAQLERRGVRILNVGECSECDVRLYDRIVRSERSAFEIGTPEIAPHPCTLQMTGEHFIHNAALALSACLALDIHLGSAIRALENFQAGDGRGRLFNLSDNVRLLDESYNASPASMNAALNALNTLGGDSRKIAILGDMAELGDLGPQAHLDLIEKLTRDDMICFACGELMKTAFDGLPEKLKGVWCEKSTDLIDPIKNFIRANDVLMVKGSNSRNMKAVIDALREI